MGQGGNINLVNGTPYDWELTAPHSYQMNSWNFPSRILAGTTSTIYIEWSETVGNVVSDDAAEATYTLSGTGLSFQVKASAGNGFDLGIVLLNFSTPGNPVGSFINLGWNWNGFVTFVLAGEQGRLTSSNPPWR